MAVKVGCHQALGWRMRRQLLDPVGSLPVAEVVVREALGGPPVTREDLVAVIVTQRGLGHLGDELRSGWGTLFKPLAWQGDLCYGPTQGSRVTFTRPDLASSRWAGVPDPDEAAPTVIMAYLAAYGPATAANLRNWLARGRIGARQLRTWFSALRNRLAEVEVDGELAYVRAEDLDDLVAARPSRAVRLLPGFDQYVLGPGTEDGNVVPAARRSAVSRQSGWISPIVVSGGRVCGTWSLKADQVQIAWFNEAGRPPRDALDAEVSRLASIVGGDLRAAIRSA